MKNKTSTQCAFFYIRTSIGLLLVLAGVFLALVGVGQFSVQAQRSNTASTNGISPLVPPGFDCATIRSQGIHIQENLRAGAIMIACGEAQGGSLDPDGPSRSLTQQIVADISAPFLGGADKDLINPGPESGTHITQSETYASANPDDPNEIVVAYNDSRGVFASPINISGASVSTDGGASFTRLTCTNNVLPCVSGQSPFRGTLGDPVMLFNRQAATWFGIFLDTGCSSQGIGGYKSTNPSDPNSWSHFCVHNGSSDDRESGAVDNNPSSPFYGRMYVSFNDFARGGGSLFVRRSSDAGATWTEVQLMNGFVRDVQITVDSVTNNVFVAAMNEGGGGFNNRINKFWRSTDGGVTWLNTYTGPAFAAPGRVLCPNNYFVCMFSGPNTWRHMGWGQPAAMNGVVHYIYDQKDGTDPANTYYIRSTDNGVTFGPPLKLNTDTTSKAQWQPNLSIAADNSLLAVWYDERGATANCVKGDETIPCYQMFARKSTDGGITWGTDSAFSDVMSPLAGQPDSGIISEYAGDYDYSNSVGNTHLHPWMDGRVVVNSASQQDAFFDKETGGPPPPINLKGKGRKVNNVNTARLRWIGATSVNVDVYRNNVVVATTANDGGYDDNTGTTGVADFTYKVCEAASAVCSNTIAIHFGP